MFLRIFAALSSSSEVYTPIFLGLESKFMKIIPTCLSCVQKLASSAAVGEVWSYHFSYLSNEIVLKRQCKAYLRNYLIIPLDKIMLFHTCTWMKIRFDCFYTFVKFLLTKLFFFVAGQLSVNSTTLHYVKRRKNGSRFSEPLVILSNLWLHQVLFIFPHNTKYLCFKQIS